MKKILLASTALVVSAGFANAEVVVGGDGYMGVAYGNLNDGIFVTTDTGATETAPGSGVFVSDYSFVYDLDIDFAVTLQSDSGLSFGMQTDLDDNATGSQGPRGWDGSIFVSGDFGTITMGDTNGAAEQVIGDLAGVGLTGLGDFNENIFLVTGAAQPAGPVARYDYNGVPGLTLSLGLTDDAGYSVGVGYGTDLFAVGLAYESVADGAQFNVFDPDAFGPGAAVAATAPNGAEHIIGMASVTFSGVTLKGVYGQADLGNGSAVDTADQYGVSAAAGFGAASVAAYYRAIDVSFTAAGAADVLYQTYGLGGAYDLGGGLSLKAGVAQAESDVAGSDSLTVADFGVAINF